MKCYRIKDWDDRENADTRKYVDLLWFRNKVKLLGEGLGHTLGAPNNRGPHLYGMFKLIEQIAAGGRLEQRGWLYRNGSPLTAARIANLLRLPEADCQEALTFFSTLPLDWIELADYPGDSPDSPPPVGRTPGEMRHPTDRRTTVVQRTLSERNKETRKAASPEDSKNQARQWRAAKSRLEELENIPDEDRTGEQEADLKKTRALVKAIQKKQAAGDFTPVTEEAK